MTVPGIATSRRDRLISALMQRLGGGMVADKAAEFAVWSDSGVDWTFVRPPRLTDVAATGRVERHAHISPRGTAIGRADLAAFVVDYVEQASCVGEAPFVASA
jgi:NAD(P)H-binding